MAKTAILNKVTMDLVGVGTSPGTIKLVLDGAGLKEEDVTLVTAKTFEPSDRYPTFKEMTMSQEERDAAAKAVAEKAEADQKKAAEKEAKAKEKAEKQAAKKAEGGSTRNTQPLEGDYHIIKPFPATPEDHPKMPIWKAIADNTNVEAAKAACPAENPKRKTNGVYTFNSEFRYFLKAGYVGMGAAPESTGDEQQAA